MMRQRNRFGIGWFILIFIIALALPSAAVAAVDLTGKWLVNSTAPAAGCSYHGTANLVQTGPSLTGSVTLSFKGRGCPSMTTMPLNCTLSAVAGFSGSCSISSSEPVMGCSYSGSANLIQTGLSFKSLVNLSLKGSGCPSMITMPLHFMLSSSPM